MSQTIHRATEIIELLAASPRSLNEVATHFEVHRTTVFRQLQTLERAGFVMHRADGQYAIGTRIIAIAQQALDNFDLRRVAHEELRALQRRVGTTVHLAQLLERSVVYIDKVEGDSSVRMYSRIGLPVLPQATGVGKVILAQLPSQRRDELLAGTEWTAFTRTTHTSRASLDADLATISGRGWGVDDSEFEDFMNCIAAPIANSTGTVLGALSISSIKVVNDLDALRHHLPDLLDTTARISAQLG
ncbi:IclR family transcriptional regulator [Microterricola pindariensis]|uniref:IclR family transcriptional regulator n=1 Tax=Microterricola pindariensis TaxID=478010 RepID=A0ABX5AVC2_9MICO|nr:IclR family transcriptional regulator [Microterricola pindariensis]PPL17802.1 hypothetical protein GY24_11110 [Microterricola pindariensis]